MTIIIFIFILALLVLVHELGHFIAAKRNGVLVEEFGIGFPPRIFSLKYKETVYSLNGIPLGGFVKLYGEEYYNAGTIHELSLQKRKQAFVYKKPHQKAAIIIAGVIGNFLLGWLLISFLFTRGVPVPTNKVIIEKVQANSPAESAGLAEKDIILNFTSSSNLINYSKKFAGQKITLVILRGNQQRKITLVPRKNPPSGQGPLGVVITSFVEKKYPWYQAPFFGLIQAFKISKQIGVELLRTVTQFILGQKPAVEVAGPIGIARYTSQAIKSGRNALMEFIALLSLNLAVINILPFPALDGGRLVFVVYEWVLKRRVNEKIERYANFIGIIILLSLAILISLNDLARLIR